MVKIFFTVVHEDGESEERSFDAVSERQILQYLVSLLNHAKTDRITNVNLF